MYLISQVGADMYSVASLTEHGPLSTAYLPEVHGQPDMLRSSHSITAPSLGSPPMTLRHLRAKQLSGTGGHTRSQAPAIGQFAYQVQWQTGEQLEPRAEEQQLQARAAVLATCSSPLAACMAGIQLLQQRSGAPLSLLGADCGTLCSSLASAPCPREQQQTASMWGLLKTAAQENPEAHLNIQFAGDVRPTVARFADSIPKGDAFGFATAPGGLVASPRLLPSGLQTEASQDFYLDVQPRGSLANLVPVAVPPQEASRGKLHMRPHAVGLNFRDVLNILVSGVMSLGCAAHRVLYVHACGPLSFVS